MILKKISDGSLRGAFTENAKRVLQNHSITAIARKLNQSKSQIGVAISFGVNPDSIVIEHPAS